MAFKIKQLDTELGEIVEKIGDILGAKIIEENENEYQICCTTSFYHLPELNKNIHYADLLIYDTEWKEYVIQDNIFMVFDRDKKELVYSEQGGSIQTCIHNYCSIVLKDKTVTMEKVENYDCTYELNKGDILDSYKNISDNI